MGILVEGQNAAHEFVDVEQLPAPPYSSPVTQLPRKRLPSPVLRAVL